MYSLFSFLAGFISLTIAIYLAPFWKNKSARLLMLLVVSVAVWSLAYGMELISTYLTLKLWWVKVEYFGATWIGMLIFSFVLTITEKKMQLNKTGYALLSIIPIVILLCVVTNDHHHLVWTNAWHNLSGGVPVVIFQRAIGFWVFVTYSYLLMFLAVIILIQSLISAKEIFKKQLLIVLVGILLPWLANLLYLFGFEELQFLDLTPIAFTISGIIFFWGLLRYQMFSLIPLAREAVLDSMDDPIIALDMNDRILDLNRAAKSLFNIDTFIPAHNKLKEFIPVLYGQVLKHRQSQLSEDETSFMVGTIQKHWNLRVTPLSKKKGTQTGWMILIRDITDKKNAEYAAKESEKIHKIMLEASPNPIVYYNETGETTYINPAFTRVFGWHTDELIGERIDFVPEENWKETKKAILKTLDQPGGNYDFITRRYTKNKDILDVSINSAIYRSKNGSSTNMVVNITDITKLKKTEYELRNTKNFIRSIINSMPSILIGLNTEGVITQWNSEAEHMTGILADKAKGSLLKDVFPSLSCHISNVKHTIEKQKIKKESKITLKMCNKKIMTDITVYPIKSDIIEGAVIRVDDISERARIEEMMVQSEKMMSVGGLAAGMAHEINNPLAGILQNIQVIRNRLSKDLPVNIETAKECGVSLEGIKNYMEKRNIFPMIEHVISSGEQAAQIVSNMLSFSRKSDHRKSSHYLQNLLEASIELIKNDYSMKKKYDFRSIKIKKEYQKNIPPIPCEKNEIQQVFLNILKNGAEAMAEASVPSPMFIIRYFRQGDQVIFEIENNGPIIDPKTKKRIFEPFFTTKGVGVGTGLGLSVSYFIITENHNGVLSVKSTPKKGTTFIMKLPIQQAKNIL
jgi:PAS domain S-box-containing protein